MHSVSDVFQGLGCQIERVIGQGRKTIQKYPGTIATASLALGVIAAYLFESADKNVFSGNGSDPIPGSTKCPVKDSFFSPFLSGVQESPQPNNVLPISVPSIEGNVTSSTRCTIDQKGKDEETCSSFSLREQLLSRLKEIGDDLSEYVPDSLPGIARGLAGYLPMGLLSLIGDGATAYTTGTGLSGKAVVQYGYAMGSYRWAQGTWPLLAYFGGQKTGKTAVDATPQVLAPHAESYPKSVKDNPALPTTTAQQSQLEPLNAQLKQLEESRKAFDSTQLRELLQNSQNQLKQLQGMQQAGSIVKSEWASDRLNQLPTTLNNLSEQFEKLSTIVTFGSGEGSKYPTHFFTKEEKEELEFLRKEIKQTINTITHGKEEKLQDKYFPAIVLLTQLFNEKDPRSLNYYGFYSRLAESPEAIRLYGEIKEAYMKEIKNLKGSDSEAWKNYVTSQFQKNSNLREKEVESLKNAVKKLQDRIAQEKQLQSEIDALNDQIQQVRSDFQRKGEEVDSSVDTSAAPTVSQEETPVITPQGNRIFTPKRLAALAGAVALEFLPADNVTPDWNGTVSSLQDRLWESLEPVLLDWGI